MGLEHEEQEVLGGGEQPDELAELEQDFEIEQELGRGESASVYRARDRALGRRVAIKVVRASHAADERQQRALREARVLAALAHPHIVAIHAVQRLSHGSLALVMQFVEGPTLRELLRERGMLPVEQATRILRDVARALLAAHAQGVVHRDVKPENIVIDRTTGRALLSDFGAAMPLDSAARLEVDNSLVGTPAYMSPEQIDGEELDGRTDVYSLGLVGWEMLSGLHPWGEGAVYEVLLRHREGDLPPVDQMRGGVPVPVANAIEGALEKDRARRWAGAAEFLTALLAPPDTPRREPRPRSDVTPPVVPTWAVPPQKAIVHSRDEQPSAHASVESADIVTKPREWTQRPSRTTSASMSRSAKRRLAAGLVTAALLIFTILVANGVVNLGAGRNGDVLAASSPPESEAEVERPGDVAPPPENGSALVDLSEERQLQVDLAAAAAELSSSGRATDDDTTELRVAPPLTRSDSLVRCASARRDDQQMCLLAWLAHHDVALNRTYRQLIAAMIARDSAGGGGGEPESVQLLRAEQRAWLTERDRECQSRATPPPDGLWATSRAACLGALGERRELQLRARLEDVAVGA